MRIMRKLIIAVLAILLTVTVSHTFAQEKRTVRIGVEGAYPPFSWVDKAGHLQGFDIDIAHALCEAMHATCTLVQQDWDGIIPALLARKYDAIIASMSITEERKQKVDFTHKYYQTPARFVRQKGSGIDITPEGLKGRTIGVQRATIHDKFLTDHYGRAIKIKRYATQDEVYLDMQAGRLDLILQDSVVALEGFLKTAAGKNYEFVGPAFSDPKWFGEGVGIALRKGNEALRDAFNAAIQQIRANGTYKKIQDHYFNFDIYGAAA